MSRLFVSWLMVSAAVLGPAHGALAQKATAHPAPDHAASPIAVKQTEPRRVAYIEHSGPYWKVGPAFVRVREYMHTHDQSGPMFLRYLHRSPAAGAGSLASQVGFTVQGNHQPKPPFKTAQRDRELVAYMIVEGRSPTPWHDHQVMRDWIRLHGYEADGPVMEIYSLFPPGVGSAPRRTEVQVALRARREEEPTARTTGPRPLPAASAQDPRPESAHGSLGADTIEPVSTLLAAERFDRIAEQLMPTTSPRDESFHVWMGQITFRIGAAAGGIEKMYPHEARVIRAVADSLILRYQAMSANSRLDPLAQAVVYIDDGDDKRARGQRAIMRDLDALLGRIALRTAGPTAVLDELAGILQRAQELVQVRQP